MGIPGLTQALKDKYTEIVNFGHCHNPIEDLETKGTVSSIVIDGPSFAYFIYYRLLSLKDFSSNPIDAVPSYNEIGKATLIYLDEIRLVGVKIDRIYFDGYLPLFKVGTRQARLEQSRRLLFNFRQNHWNGWKAPVDAPHQAITNAEKLFDYKRGTGEKFHSIPAAPFLVPMVIEKLSTSRYARVTKVVYGEADSYCAARAHQLGGCILTKDSDMFVYDLGLKGCFTFFENINLIRHSDNSLRTIPIMQADVYRPRKIAQQLGLDELGRLAYEMKEDPHRSFSSNLQKAIHKSSDRVNTKEYQDFKDEYNLSNMHEDGIMPYKNFIPERFLEAIDNHIDYAGDRIDTKNIDLSELQKFCSGWCSGPSKNPERLCPMKDKVTLNTLPKMSIWKYISERSTQNLDPRVSELVLQLQQRRIGTESQFPNPAMFLPILIDDPGRTSAWFSSFQTRRLAYSLLNRSMHPRKRIPHILEYSRRGERVVPTEIPLMTPEETVAEMDSFLSKQQLIRQISQGTEVDFWRTYALYELCQWRNNSGSELSNPKKLRKLMECGYVGDRLEWDAIDDYAHIEAILYSHRILKMINNVALEQQLEGNHAEKSNSIQKNLDSLPRLEDLLVSRIDLRHHQEDRLPKNYWGNIIKKFQDGIKNLGNDEPTPGEEEEPGVGEEEEEEEGRPSKGKRRCRERRAAPANKVRKQTIAKATSKNMFDILGEE